MKIKDEPKIKIDCQQSLLRSVRFNSDGQYALTCGADRTIKLWRPTKLLHLKTYKGHSSDVIDCQSNHDSSQFISCSNDRSLIVWEVETGKILRRFRHLASLNNVCYGPESSTVLTSSIDGTVRIYDVRAINSWEPIQTLAEANDSVTCCKVSENLIYSVSLDKTLRTYDIRTGKLFADTMNCALGHISAGRDDLCLLVTCLRGSILLVDRENAAILNEFSGNVNKLFKMESVFLLNDSMIASGSEDSKAYIWDTLNSEPKLVLDHKAGNNQIIQSLSSDSLDCLLTACGNFMYFWTVE